MLPPPGVPLATSFPLASPCNILLTLCTILVQNSIFREGHWGAVFAEGVWLNHCEGLYLRKWGGGVLFGNKCTQSQLCKFNCGYGFSLLTSQVTQQAFISILRGTSVFLNVYRLLRKSSSSSSLASILLGNIYNSITKSNRWAVEGLVMVCPQDLFLPFFSLQLPPCKKGQSPFVRQTRLMRS